MRAARHISDNRIDPPCDTSAHSRDEWIEAKTLEIITYLKSGGWYSPNRRLTYYPRDAMQELNGLDPEEVFRHDTAVAAFWLAEQGHAADKGEMKLEAAKVLEEVFGKAIDVMAKNLAEREYEIEVMHEH